jgi:hypothetical protein
MDVITTITNKSLGWHYGNKKYGMLYKGAFSFNVIEKEKKAKDKGMCQNNLCRFSHNDSTVQP